MAIYLEPIPRWSCLWRDTNNSKERTVMWYRVWMRSRDASENLA